MEVLARRQLPSALLALVAALAVTAVARAELELYRPEHRTAAELVALAGPLIGEEGVVTADPGTGTLVLQGPPEVLAEALEVLRRLDVAPQSYQIESRVITLADLARMGVALEGWVEVGDLRIGRGPQGEAGLAARAARAASHGAMHSMLRVLEGEVADVWTGRTEFAEFPTPHGTARIPVDTRRSGLRVRPRGVADGRVEVEIQPILSGDGPGPAVSVAGAAARVRVEPGSWVAIAGIRTRSGDAAAAIASAEVQEQSSSVAVLVRVTPVQ